MIIAVLPLGVSLLGYGWYKCCTTLKILKVHLLISFLLGLLVLLMFSTSRHCVSVLCTFGGFYLSDGTQYAKLKESDYPYIFYSAPAGELLWSNYYTIESRQAHESDMKPVFVKMSFTLGDKVHTIYTNLLPNGLTLSSSEGAAYSYYYSESTHYLMRIDSYTFVRPVYFLNTLTFLFNLYLLYLVRDEPFSVLCSSLVKYVKRGGA